MNAQYEDIITAAVEGDVARMQALVREHGSQTVRADADPDEMTTLHWACASGSESLVAFMLSDMQVETDALRWLTWKAASQLEQGSDATQASVFAWNTAAEQGMKIADNGVQILGGHGFIREHPVEMWYRHARTLSVLDGVAGV